MTNLNLDEDDFLKSVFEILDQKTEDGQNYYNGDLEKIKQVFYLFSKFKSTVNCALETEKDGASIKWHASLKPAAVELFIKLERKTEHLQYSPKGHISIMVDEQCIDKETLSTGKFYITSKMPHGFSETDVFKNDFEFVKKLIKIAENFRKWYFNLCLEHGFSDIKLKKTSYGSVSKWEPCLGFWKINFTFTGEDFKEITTSIGNNDQETFKNETNSF
jgi:hypothetical protein